MSITRSYNKHTDTYYAYDTTYEWDEKLQKKVQHKKCIGKIDPETNEVIPTGKRGRPARRKPTQIPAREHTDAREPHGLSREDVLPELKSLRHRIESIEASVSRAADDLNMLRESIVALMNRLHPED